MKLATFEYNPNRDDLQEIEEKINKFMEDKRIIQRETTSYTVWGWANGSHIVFSIWYEV